MRFAAVLLATSLAYAQTTKVFQLAHQQKPQDLREIATIVRSLLDIEQVSVDDTAGTLSVNTSGGKAAVVEWLLHKLDRSAKTPPDAGQEYYSPVPGPEVVRIFYCTNAATRPALQELATNVRAVGDIRRVFVYNRLKAVIVRDAGDKVMLAAWLIDQLNQPEGAPAPEPHEYKFSDQDVARVFELANAPNPQAVQEIVTLIRSVADIQRLFIYNVRKAVPMRARPERIELAAWLVKELDRPATGAAADTSAAHEYRLPEDASPRDGETVVRIFYLPSATPEGLHKTESLVRSNTQMRRTFTYNTLGALAVRGTPGQIATAEKTIEEIGKAKPE